MIKLSKILSEIKLVPQATPEQINQMLEDIGEDIENWDGIELLDKYNLDETSKKESDRIIQDLYKFDKERFNQLYQDILNFKQKYNIT